jgi:hypothetical protein
MRSALADSLLVIGLFHKRAEAWVASLQVLRNQEIMDADLNEILAELQNEIANELNSQNVPVAQAATS